MPCVDRWTTQQQTYINAQVVESATLHLRSRQQGAHFKAAFLCRQSDEYIVSV